MGPQPDPSELGLSLPQGGSGAATLKGILGLPAQLSPEERARIQAPTPLERVIQAGREGYESAGGVLTPEAQEALDKAQGVLPAVGRFGVNVLNTAKADLGAVFRGGQQFVQEATPDLHLPSVGSIPLGGNRSISGELTPGSLGHELAAMPEAFPLGGKELGGLRPVGPVDLTQARSGATRGTFQVGPSKAMPVTLDELTDAIRRVPPPPPPAPESAAAPETAPPTEAAPGERSFTTSKGSTYVDHGDGTTTRNKAQRPEHGPYDHGPQPTSERTFYVSPEDANKLSEIQTRGGGPSKVIAPVGDGQWGIKYTNGPDTGKFESRTLVTPTHEPALGQIPVELWNDGNRVHFGNEITDVTGGSTPTPTAPDLATGFPTRAAGEPYTAQYGKDVANHLYDFADRVGGNLQPQLVQRFVNYLSNLGQRTALGKISGRYVQGAQNFTDLVNDLRSETGRPWSLREVHELDEDLGDMIDADYRNNRGLTKVGRNLLDAQQTLRRMIDDASETDVGGGRAGFQALKSGRQAYSQAMKLSDLERMEARAENAPNPLTELRRQIATLRNNSKRSRGYNTEELKAMTTAGKQGAVNAAVQAVGSRMELLIPLWIEAHSGGITGGLASYGAVKTVRGVTGWAARKAQTRRLNRARDVIGSRIPTAPAPTPQP
jgi:hypothetical protein